MAPNGRQGRASGSNYNYSRQGQASSRQRQTGPANRPPRGPKSVYDVFEYATDEVERTGAGKRRGGVKRVQRATINGTEERGPRFAGSEGEDEDEDGGAVGGSSSRAAPDYGTAPILGGGEDDDDEAGWANQIASEDDEEIDSDEAFDESDEEKYADWKFASDKGKGKGRSRKDEDDAVDSDEEEDDGSEDEEEEEEEDGDMMDLSKMLDSGGSDAESEDADEDDESDEEGNEHDGKLQQYMDAFSKGSSKRDADRAALASDPSQRKRRVLQDRAEAIAEGEWNAPVRHDGQGGLTIDDLLKPINEQTGTSLSALRNTAKSLRTATDSSTGQARPAAVASKRGGGALQAPLPTIVQDRLDRQAAYEETKAEVQGWQSTIQRVRDAKHLSFPLQPDQVTRPSTAGLTSTFKASNDFERQVADLLEREGATEKQVQQREELQMNKRGMSADEIRQRTAELRRMRDLLFREEQKAKRISKIKSKTYRKIARKEKARQQEKARLAGVTLDGEEGEDPTTAEEARMEAERARAKERATLKHKNAGKWAKDALGMKGIHDMPETRQAIEEQLLRGEQLRRKIHAEDSDLDSEEDGSLAGDSSDDDDGPDDDGGVRREGFDEMATLRQKMAQEDAQEVPTSGKKGLFTMKFMEQARQRKARDAQDQMDAFEREMQEEEDQTSDQDDDQVQARSMQVGANGGRRVYGATNDNRTKAALPQNEETDEAAQTQRPKAYKPTSASTNIRIEVDDVRPQAAKQDNRRVSPDVEQGDQVNPWLASGEGKTKVSRKRNEATISKEGSAIGKAAHRIQKHAAKGQEARQAQEAEGELVIDPEARLSLRHDQATAKSTRSAAPQIEVDLDDDSDASVDADVVAVQTGRGRGGGTTAIAQRQMVAEAFAGDDVLADFAEEKQAAIDADAPQEIDTFLPGWGAWTGKGVKKVNARQAAARKEKFIKRTAGLTAAQRTDAGMDHVILSQKPDKKAERFRSTDVPYPYTSRAQYEMAMRNPLGPEWNTRTTHQRRTLPRVTTKMGKVIRPIERLF